MITVDPGSLLPAPPSQRCATRVVPSPTRHPPILVHRMYFVIFLTGRYVYMDCSCVHAQLAFRQREITSKTNKPPQKPALHRRALNALGGTNRRPRLALTLAATRHVVCGPAPSSQSASEREWRAITAITTLTGRWEAETAGTHKRKVTGRRGSRLNPNEHTIRCVGAHRAVPDCRQRRSQTCQVRGYIYAVALATLDDHESSGPPDGVGSVYEEARYRKKKLGASGHATKDEKDEEQHTQRERERMMLGL